MVAINIRLHSFRLTAVSPATLPNSITLHASCTTGRLPTTSSPTLTITSETTASLPVDWKLEWAERLPDRLALRAASLRLRVTHKPRNRLSTVRCLPPPPSSCPQIGSLKLDLLSLARGTVAYSLRLRDNSGGPTPYVLAFDVVVEQPARVPLTFSQLELRHSQQYFTSAIFLSVQYGLSGVVARSSLLPISESEFNPTNSELIRHNWRDPISLLLHAPNLGDLVHSSIVIALHDAHAPPGATPIAQANVAMSTLWAAFSRPRNLSRIRIQLSDGSILSGRLMANNSPPSAQMVGGVTTDDAITGARPVIFGIPLADMSRMPTSPDLPSGWVRLVDTLGYEYYHHIRSRNNVWTLPPDQSASAAIRADESRARALGYERTKQGVFRSVRARIINEPNGIANNGDGRDSSDDSNILNDENDTQPVMGRLERRTTEDLEMNNIEIIEVWPHPAAKKINVPSFDAPDDGSSITMNQDAETSPRTSISLSTIDPMELHPAAYTTRFKNVYVDDENLEMGDSMILMKEGPIGGGRSSTSSGSVAAASGSDFTNAGETNSNSEGTNNTTSSGNAAAKLGQGKIVEMQWESLENASNEGTEGHTLTAVNGGRTLLKFGGTVHASRTNAMYAFDVDGMQWSKVQAQGVMPQARAGHGAVALGSDRSRLLIFGGISPQGRLNDLHTYHVEKGIWSPVSAMGTPPEPRGRLGMTASTDTAFVFGGRSLYRYLGGKYYDANCVNAFIAGRSQWIQMTPRGPGPRPSIRSGCVVEFFNDRHMLVHGGYLDGEQYFDDTFIFDIASSSWHKLPYPTDGVRPTSRESHASTVLGSQIVIYGGDSSRGLMSDLHLFDTNLMKWRRSPDLVGHSPGKVCGSAMATTHDDRIIHVGGDIGFRMSRATHTLDISHCSAVDAVALKELAEGRGPDAGRCVVCLDNKVETIFLWCGHSVCCRSCARMLKQLCPLCRKPFSKIMYSSFEQSYRNLAHDH